MNQKEKRKNLLLIQLKKRRKRGFRPNYGNMKTAGKNRNRK